MSKIEEIKNNMSPPLKDDKPCENKQKFKFSEMFDRFLKKLKILCLFCALFIVFVSMIYSSVAEYPPQLFFLVVVISTAVSTVLFVCIYADEFNYDFHVKKYGENSEAVQSFIRDGRILQIDSTTESHVWNLISMVHIAMITALFTMMRFRIQTLDIADREYKVELLPGVIPGILMIVYSYFMLFHLAVLSSAEEKRQIQPVGIGGEWRTVLNAFIKQCLFISCCYFVNRIEAFDESRNKDPSIYVFRKFAACVSFLHFVFFCTHLWLKPVQRLSNSFKFVPLLPSLGLLYYAYHRCHPHIQYSKEVSEMAHEDIGLLSNAFLLAIMIVYQDFVQKLPKSTKLDYYKRKYFAEAKKQGIACERKSKENEVNQGLKTKQVPSAFRRVLGEFLLPMFLLLPNCFAANTFTIDVLDYFGGHWIVFFAIFVIIYFKCNFHRGQGVIPFCQMLCVWSMYTEFPQTFGLVTEFSDYTSIPLLFFTGVVFIVKLVIDTHQNNVGDIQIYTRVFYYWLQHGHISKNWKNIADTLASIKNIEEYEVNVNEEGEISLSCSHSKSESVSSQTTESGASTVNTDTYKEKTGNSNAKNDDSQENIDDSKAKTGGPEEKTDYFDAKANY